MRVPRWLRRGGQSGGVLRRMAAVPVDRRRLGDGVVVIEAGVQAKLLGLRLLRLDAEVLVTPAQLDSRTLPASPGPAQEPLRSTPLPSLSDRPVRRPEGDSTVGMLAQARQLVTESERSLAATRRASGLGDHDLN